MPKIVYFEVIISKNSMIKTKTNNFISALITTVLGYHKRFKCSLYSL